ncbi:MAG: nucleotidyl transferase AbiEii/AbiGii toxin family protein [Acidimicrobiia bacterium]
MEVERVQVAEGFARLVVFSDGKGTTVDLAWDARLLPPERTPEGPILAEEELAADKMLALFGRAAARDFVDVWVLASRYGLERLCRLAAEKDPGFDRLMLAEMLGRMRRLPRAASRSKTRSTKSSGRPFGAGARSCSVWRGRIQTDRGAQSKRRNAERPLDLKPTSGRTVKEHEERR